MPALSVPVPIVDEPSRNVTVPVIVPAVVEETVAVNVTLAPGAAGVCDVARVVEVAAFETAFTVCVKATEVLVTKFVSPLYAAVMEWVPCVSVEVETPALPPLSVAGDPI